VHRAAARVLLASLLLAPRIARADEAEAPAPAIEEPAAAPSKNEPAPGPVVQPPNMAATPPPTAPSAGAENGKTELRVRPTGYVEVFYSYNLNRPSNGITNYRGFDNRHSAITLSNVALGATWDYGPVGGKVMLQVGSTPATYYSAEPALAGAGGANATGADLWRYVQEAYLSYKLPVGRGIVLQAGLVASPIGPEAFAVKDNWTWSRSNLFFGFPYYHLGVRATYELSDSWSATLGVFNGWNSVVDNNEAKSVQTNVTYRRGESFTINALYFGGIERPAGAPEGEYWRHDFDVVAQVQAAPALAFIAEANAGFEPTRFGTAAWVAGALSGRVRAAPWLYFAARGDRFHEVLARERGGAGRTSTPLFWNGVEWVTSATATIDFRPHESISFRFEYRHDVAEAPLYFGRNVAGDGSTALPFLPNARTQDTLLVGATAWF